MVVVKREVGKGEGGVWGGEKNNVGKRQGGKGDGS